MGKKPEAKPAGERGELEPFARWRPFRELGFGAPLERFLEEAWGERARLPKPLAPAMDISEEETRYVVTVELAGVGKDDVTVELEEGILTVRGEKKSEREEKKAKRHWVERSYGSFVRSFTLPANADADRIEASFRDGVLRLVIPKTEEAKPKTIAIRS